MSWLDEHTGQDANRNRSGTRLSLNLSNGQLIGAIFTGLCGLGAAFITGAFGGSHIIVGNGALPTPTVIITKTITARPSGDVSSSTSGSVVPRPNSKPTTISIPLLRPIISQPGWALAWHQTASIGPQGITFGSSDPQTGDGSNYDLQYVPGNDSGWGYNGYVDAFSYWPYTYAPGPAIINGISGTSTGGDVAGTQAHVGDRLYVTLSTPGNGCKQDSIHASC